MLVFKILPDDKAQIPIKEGIRINLIKKCKKAITIISLNETTHRYCTEVELQLQSKTSILHRQLVQA